MMMMMIVQSTGVEGSCVLCRRWLGAGLPAEISTATYSTPRWSQRSWRVWYWVIWWGGHEGNQGEIRLLHTFIVSCNLLLQERVWDDVGVATSFRQADRSWARRFAVASPRFIGCRSASTVLSQDCLGRPILRFQLSGGPAMQAWRARWWSCQGRHVQWRTDDDCGQCLIGMAARCGSVSHH